MHRTKYIMFLEYHHVRHYDIGTKYQIVRIYLLQTFMNFLFQVPTRSYRVSTGILACAPRPPHSSIATTTTLLPP